MPADYEAVRDSCIKRKKEKSKDGKISDSAMQNCKKMAAIWYYKKHGKPVQHAEAKELDEIEIEIMAEQLDFFGTLEEYDSWNEEG